MALITLAGRSHVLGQFFDVLAPYGGKAGLQVCQFFICQENILVTAIGGGGVSLLYISLLKDIPFQEWDEDYAVIIVGPPVMMKFTAQELSLIHI